MILSKFLAFLEVKKIKTLTKLMQDAIMLIIVLELLIKGHQRFIDNLKINRNLLQQANDTSEGQHPFAVILSCIV